MEIGQKMKELREARSLNLKQLAELVECTPSLISQLERGKAENNHPSGPTSQT